MIAPPTGEEAQAAGQSDWWLYAYLAAVIAGTLGFVGAAAFNPDSGFLLQSETLWSICGLTTYAGFAAVVVLLLLAVGSVLMRAAGGLIFRLASRRRGSQRGH